MKDLKNKLKKVSVRYENIENLQYTGNTNMKRKKRHKLLWVISKNNVCLQKEIGLESIKLNWLKYEISKISKTEPNLKVTKEMV